MASRDMPRGVAEEGPRTQAASGEARAPVESPGATALTSRTEPLTVHDPEGLVGETFDMQATPSAVLLGADGLLAGGPVVGSLAVPQLVDDILHELAGLPTP